MRFAALAPLRPPQPFLTCGFEAGIVTLTLRPQGVSPFKIEAAAVNGKPVIVWNGLVFRAALVFLAVVPVFVAAGTCARFGLAEGTAEFLPGTIIVGGFAIFVYSQSSITGSGVNRKNQTARQGKRKIEQTVILKWMR